jgi:hypothetical protein
MRRQLPGEHLRQCRLVENAAQARPNGHPDLGQMSGNPRILGLVCAQAPDLGERAVHRTDHGSERYLTGWPSQGVPAFGAPLATDQVGAPKLAEDRFDELARQPLLCHHLVHLHEIRFPGGQAQQRSNRVVRLR